MSSALSPEKMFFTIKGAAEVCSVSPDTIRRAINSGRLRAKRTGKNRGGLYLVSRQALEDWFEGLEEA